MPFSRRTYQEGVSSPLVAGRTVELEIPRDIAMHIEGCCVDVDGAVNVTTAFTPATGIRRFNQLSQIEVWADSRNLFTGPAYFFAIGQPGRTTLGIGQTTPPAATVGTNTFSGSYVIDFAAIDALVPKDSNIRSGNYARLVVKITASQVADMFSGATAGVGTFTSYNATISSQCILEERDKNGNVLTLPSLLRTVTAQTQIDISAVATEKEIILNPGPLFRGLFIAVYNGATGEPIPTATPAITRFSVGQRNNRWLTRREVTVRNMQSFDYEGAIHPGCYCLDFLKQGEAPVRHTELIPTADVLDFRLWVNTAGIANAKMDVFQLGYFPLNAQ